MVIAGALVGVGVLLIVAGLRPYREPLGVVLGRLDTVERTSTSTPAPSVEAAATPANARLAGLAQRFGPVARLVARSEADLRVVGRSRDEQAARLVLIPALALLLGPVILFAWALPSGTHLGRLPVWVAPLGAVLGVVYVRLELRSKAAAARVQFRAALAAFCDVTSIALASGLGVVQALTSAARAGDGWAFTELRYALEHGRLHNLRAWDALDRAGVELAVPDLCEFAAAVRLAGDEGAAVAATVAQKARSLRDRLASEAERAAVSTTEAMSIPAALMLVGMFLFLLYPAVVAITR